MEELLLKGKILGGVCFALVIQNSYTINVYFKVFQHNAFT